MSYVSRRRRRTSTPLHHSVASFIHAFTPRLASPRTYGSVAVSRASPRSTSPWRLPSARTSRVRDCRRTTAGDAIEPRRASRVASRSIPITLPTIPHYVASTPFVSPGLGSRPVTRVPRARARRHPPVDDDSTDDTDDDDDARRARERGFVAQLVERALCNDRLRDVCENMCEVPRSKLGRSTFLLVLTTIVPVPHVCIPGFSVECVSERCEKI